MTGSFAENVNDAKEFFISAGITPQFNRIALDLGSGHGIHSAALKELRFDVVAVDFSKQLLHELKQNLGSEVKVIEADITDFGSYSGITPELIICMGDTLTHLESFTEVKKLIRNSAEMLPVKGRFVLSFRSLAAELTGEKRFIPVKSDNNRILTCFLEYFPEHVMVSDLLYENISGKWEMKVSSYPKLRLGTNAVRSIFEENGLVILSEKTIKGMTYFVSQKK